MKTLPGSSPIRMTRSGPVRGDEMQSQLGDRVADLLVHRAGHLSPLDMASGMFMSAAAVAVARVSNRSAIVTTTSGSSSRKRRHLPSPKPVVMARSVGSPPPAA